MEPYTTWYKGKAVLEQLKLHCLSRAGDQVVDPGWLAGLSQDGQELTTLPVNKLRRHHPATANREA